MVTLIAGQPTIMLLATSPIDMLPELEGIPITVKVTKPLKPMVVDHWAKYRPVPGGVAISPGVSAGAGTLGLTLYKDGLAYFLSNYHVLMLSPTPGNEIIQPAWTTISNRIGYTVGAMPLISAQPMLGDVAWALFDIPDMADYSVLELTQGEFTSLDSVVEPEIGMRVAKSGITTGYTEGTIIAVDSTFLVSYGGSIGDVTFVDGITVQGLGFLKPGDSGSAVFTNNGNFIGLAYAGSDELACVVKAKHIRDALGTGFTFRKQYAFGQVPTVAPIAGFTASVESGVAPLTVLFTDTSNGDVITRTWDFGDGQTDTITNPVHIFAVPGNYLVTLTVENGAGKSTASLLIIATVNPSPLPSGTNKLLALSGIGLGIMIVFGKGAKHKSD